MKASWKWLPLNYLILNIGTHAIYEGATTSQSSFVNYTWDRGYECIAAANRMLLNLDKLSSKRKLHIEKYLIDSTHSNCLTNTDYAGGIEKDEDYELKVKDNKILLTQEKLETNGLVLWGIYQN